MIGLEGENGITVESVLKEAGFTVSQRCCSRPSCFDYAARREDKLVFVKVQDDIGSISRCDAIELKALSERMSAASLLLSEKAREKPLEDDTVYSRYGIIAVTLKTFEDIVLHKTYPLILAGPGGYFDDIDGEAIKKRRQHLGLSVGELSEMMGTSRRTLYGYEKGMANASVSSAYNLISILGIPVAKPIDVFENSQRISQTERFITAAKRSLKNNRLLCRILQRLSRCNVATFRRAPFDFVIDVQEDRTRILGGVADDREKELDRRANEIFSIGQVIHAKSVLITEGVKPNSEILCIQGDAVSNINDPSDLIKTFM